MFEKVYIEMQEMPKGLAQTKIKKMVRFCALLRWKVSHAYYAFNQWSNCSNGNALEKYQPCR